MKKEIMKVKNGYVFKAVNTENGKYYIGKRVSYIKNLTPEYCKKEIYYGSGVSLPKYGYVKERDYQVERSKHFTKDILYVGSDYEEMEEFFLELHDAENDDNSYNRTNSGKSKGTTLNKISVNKNGEIRFISKDQLEFFTQDGWSLGMNLKTIFKNNEMKKVPLEQLQDFLNLGWTQTNPNPTTKGKKWLNKDGISIMVDTTEIEKYTSEGWVLGCLNKGNSGRLFVSNEATGDRLYIDPEDLEKYTRLGYVQCSSNPFSNIGTVHVYRGEDRRMISKSEVDTYLSMGYNLGRSIKSNRGKIHIIKDLKTKIIKQEELDYYLSEGWVRGSHVKNNHSKGRIWINNGSHTTLISSSEFDEFASKGYVKGRGKLK